jgi:hypothetical protein
MKIEAIHQFIFTFYPPPPSHLTKKLQNVEKRKQQNKAVGRVWKLS